MSKNLVQGLSEEIARVDKIRELYLDLEGGAGLLGAHVMGLQLEEARQALYAGDVLAMMRYYQDLKEVEL